MSNTFTWNTTSGVWSTGSNWTDITSGTAGPPTSADTAEFFQLNGQTGGTITGTGTALDVFFAGLDPWVLDGMFTTGEGLIAPAAGSSGDVVVQGTGSEWATSGDLITGQLGAGTLTIDSGATISASGTFDAVGNDAGSDGSLVISAGGTFISTLAAQTSNYALNIGDQGSSGTLPGAAGNALVTGAGALLDLGSNELSIGLNGGDGSLTVANGGSVAVSTPDSSTIAALSVGKVGSGTVTVTGAGSELTADGSGYFGRGGTGALLVTADGVFSDQNDPTGAGGVSIGVGSTQTGQPTGGSGSATISNGGSLVSSQNINVGGDGVTGNLNVNGGTVQADARLLVGVAEVLSGTTEAGSGIVNIGSGGVFDIIGNGITASGTSALGIGTYSGTTETAGGTGTVNVIGPGAILNAGSNYINIGVYGVGQMTVGQGGSVSSGSQFATNAAAEIGDHAGAEGQLTVTDSGSTFNAHGQLDVGVGGDGALLVKSGGTVVTGGNTLFARGGLVIGFESGSSGDVTVTGSGSEITNVGQFNIGGSANSTNGTLLAGSAGAMLIAAGGLVTTSLPVGTAGPGADIAASPGTDGSSVTVTGPASTWSIGGTLIVGDVASGALDVSAGGAVGATALVLGNSTTGVGDLSLSGTASSVTLATQLTVGNAGIADLSIDNAATLSGTDGDIGLAAGASGVVDIEGAGSRLDLSDNLNIGDAGTGVLIMGAGTTLSVENNLNIGASGALDQFGGVIDPATGTIQTGGSLGGAGGTDTFSNYLLNDGTFGASSGLPETLNAGSIEGTGVLQVGNGGTLVVNAGTVEATQTVAFTNAGTPAVLQIGTLGGFGAALGNFNGLDSVVVQGVSIGSDAYAPGTGGAAGVLTLYSDVGQGGSVLGTLNVAAGFPAGDEAALEVVTNGTIGGVPCFAAGTRIATERGLVAVEALCVGDRVRLAPEGPDGAGWLAVAWLGRREVDCRHHPKPRAVWPVRVRAGAFGAGCPERDVYLSPDHAVYADGVLIPVKHLIDGASVAQVAVERVAYFHVELERHAVLLAEGLAAESYLDTGDRSSFINGGGAVRLHADFASRRWEAQGCAPLVVVGPEVERVKQGLVARAAA